MSILTVYHHWHTRSSLIPQLCLGKGSKVSDDVLGDGFDGGPCDVCHTTIGFADVCSNDLPENTLGKCKREYF